MTDLLDKLANFNPFTAIVVGDYMLDQLVQGAAERLSPDAPVPVLHATQFENSPGGSANVARCLRAIKGNVFCIGVTGAETEGTILRDALLADGCNVDGLIQDHTRQTTIKRSHVGLAQHRHPQKMFRVDIESREPLSDELNKKIINAVESVIDSVDVVCLEDYNKGVCSPSLCRTIINLSRRKGKPVLVDPAAIEDYAKYKGATAITPNRSEAEIATSLDTPIEASLDHNVQMTKILLKDLCLEAVVLTLDKSGAVLALPTEEPVIVPTVARSVYDVTGAGDMVLAALAGAIANNFTWNEAVRFANAAAGLEVEAFGAQPIPFANIRQSLVSEMRDLDGKIRTLDDLIIELEVHKETGRKIVLTNGCFDVIHAGHVGYLREAASLGDILVVAVNSDSQVHELKGEGRPVYKQRERLEILSEFACIDYLIVFAERTAHTILESIRPDIYVKGGDYLPEEVVEYDLIKPMMDKGELEFHTLAFRPGLSSSEVIERFSNAYRPSKLPADS